MDGRSLVERVLLSLPWQVHAGMREEELVAVGPPGVFVLVVGALDAALDSSGAAAWGVEQVLAGCGLSPVAVRQVAVADELERPEQRPDVLLTPVSAVSDLVARPAVLSPAQLTVIGDALAGAGYVRLSSGSGSSEPAGPSWLTFLDPSQLELVRRDYPGPAWISGPAGTGKTVVALHRMARLARRDPRRLLYLTFVSNLPMVAAAAYRRLAPESAHRAEFTTIHGWARDVLFRRGVRWPEDRGQPDAAFAEAWGRVGVRGRLAVLCSDPRYWRDELDLVVKGCGLTSLAEYLRAPRTGRRIRLDDDARAAMWALRDAYESVLQASGGADRNDLLRATADELSRAPLDAPYALVVADEAQDMTRTGLQLLHGLAGDSLLLVGDGEQAVYPIGSNLSEAGIPLRSRCDLLRVNYRNTAEVLDLARGLDPVNRFDDSAELRLRDVQATLAGGDVRHYTATTPEDHDVELVTALRTCPVAPGDIALLVSSAEDASHYRRVLHAAQIPAVSLADYTGRRIDAVKVGLIRRAKGLEFRAVFLPGHGPSGPALDEVGVREALVGLTRARDFVWTGSVVGY